MLFALLFYYITHWPDMNHSCHNLNISTTVYNIQYYTITLNLLHSRWPALHLYQKNWALVEMSIRWDSVHCQKWAFREIISWTLIEMSINWDYELYTDRNEHLVRLGALHW